jgi:hypothetical protein
VTRKTNPLPFDPAAYAQINPNDLMVYAVHALHKPGAEIAAEDIVHACFALFPERFALRNYPQWPDSALVSRRWRECKHKGYLKGNALKGFQLTVRGGKRAEKLEQVLGRVKRGVPPTSKPKVEKVPAQKVHPELKARAKKYVRSIETSDAYKHFKKGQPINEFDFRSLLLTTLESPPATLARNLAQFKEYVNIHARADLLSFLEFTEGKFSHLLGKPEIQAGGRKAGKGS